MKNHHLTSTNLFRPAEEVTHSTKNDDKVRHFRAKRF